MPTRQGTDMKHSSASRRPLTDRVTLFMVRSQMAARVFRTRENSIVNEAVDSRMG